MRITSLAALGLLIACLVACSSSSRQPAETAPAPVATHTAASTGPLTEAQFKALHELPTAGPATRRGETIQLPGGGSPAAARRTCRCPPAAVRTPASS